MRAFLWSICIQTSIGKLTVLPELIEVYVLSDDCNWYSYVNGVQMCLRVIRINVLLSACLGFAKSKGDLWRFGFVPLPIIVVT